MMRMWFSLCILASAVEVMAFDNLLLMQRHADFTREHIDAAQTKQGTECEGDDCDISRYMGGHSLAHDKLAHRLDGHQSLQQEVEDDEVAVMVRKRNPKNGKWYYKLHWVNPFTMDESSWSRMLGRKRSVRSEEEEIEGVGFEKFFADHEKETKLQSQLFNEAKKHKRSEDSRPVHVKPLENETYQMWGLCNASFHSNLGGLGPDDGEKVLRYYNVAHVLDEHGNRQDLDLVLENVGEYQAYDVGFNGLVAQNSCFGQVNVKSYKRGTYSVTLRFNWYFAGTTTEAVPPKQFFTIYDVDGSRNSAEAVTLYNRVHDVYASNNTLLNRSGDLESGLTFSAEGLPNNVPLPRDPENLTLEQQSRAVTVSYVQKAHFKMTFSVTGGRRGRNFAFTGHSVLVVPTPPPTPTPTAAPVSEPSAPPGGRPGSRPMGTDSTTGATTTAAPASEPSAPPGGRPGSRPTGSDPTTERSTTTTTAPASQPAPPGGRPGSRPIGTDPTTEAGTTTTAAPASEPSAPPGGRPGSRPIGTDATTETGTTTTAVPASEPSAPPGGRPGSRPMGTDPTTTTEAPASEPSAPPGGRPGPRPTGSDPTTETATTTTTAPEAEPAAQPDGRPGSRPTGSDEGEECKDCIIWGDPHIITFQARQKNLQRHPAREAYYRTHGWKADQISVVDVGTYWLVKTNTVQIQGRYWVNRKSPNNTTGLGAIAVGGSFLGGNLLVVRTETGKVMWNDEEILHSMPSEFRNDFVHATYNNATELVTTGKIGSGMVIRFPEGISLTVNRWRQSLDAKISVCGSIAGSVSGQCGRLTEEDGDELDFAAQSLREWRTSQKLPLKDSIFPDGRSVEKVTAKFYEMK